MSLLSCPQLSVTPRSVGRKLTLRDRCSRTTYLGLGNKKKPVGLKKHIPTHYLLVENHGNALSPSLALRVRALSLLFPLHG